MPEATTHPMRYVFMGTPEFAAVILERLLDWPGGRCVGVYTQPDRPSGRGQVCKACDVKELALVRGLDIFQPSDCKSEKSLDELRALRPDVICVAAYGLILPQPVLDIPAHGCVNVHASLLPRYRGAAPIQRAIVNGERVTGVSIMQMALGMDAGPVLAQRAMGIGMNDTASDMHDQLADLGGRLLVETLDAIALGEARAMPQDDSRATYAPKLRKEEGLINWNRPAAAVHDQIRGLHPWPGAYFFLENGYDGESLRLSVAPGVVGPEKEPQVAPGDIVGPCQCEESGSEYLAVACADKLYYISHVKPSGRRLMDARAFVCGYMSRC